MRKTTDRHWLDMAEYVSNACSVAGSVAAVASQQVVYVAAPLTLALSLSLANRQRFQQQIQQQTTTAIRDVQQQIQQQTTTAIWDVQQQIQQQTTTTIRDVHQVVQILVYELVPELTLLSTNIDQLSQQMRNLPPSFDSSSLEQRVAYLEQNICTFETCLKGLFLSVNQLQSSTTPIESAIAQLRNQLNTLAQQFDT